MTTWFTSDEHYDHVNILAYCGRPYSSLEEMREDLIARHNARVKPEDHVIHLGDFSLNKRTVEVVLPRLVGRHHLVCGNHDACYQGKKGWRAACVHYRHYFETVQMSLFYMVGPYQVYCHHLPLGGASLEDRRALAWPTKEDMRGAKVLVHGHVHGRWAQKENMINVGVDVRGFAPMSGEEVLGLIEEEGGGR